MRLVALAFALALGSAACGGGGGGEIVTMTLNPNGFFVPSSIMAKPGDSVIFKNDADRARFVSDPAGLFGGTEDKNILKRGAALEWNIPNSIELDTVRVNNDIPPYGQGTIGIDLSGK